MKQLLLSGCFALIFGLISIELVHAAPGDNCQIDITAGIPAGFDWQQAMIIQAVDGSIWQRAVISNPEFEFQISEAGEYHVTGLAAPHADVQVFFAAAPVGDGKVPVPAPGTCFEAAKADQYGLFTLVISPHFLWSGLGQRLMVDAFYRQKNASMSDFQDKNGSIANYSAASWVLPKFVKVVIDRERTIEIEHNATNFAVANSLTSASFSNADRDVDGNCQVLCKSGPIYRGVELKPWRLPATLLGNNLAVSGGDAVQVGRTMHTYFVGIPGKSALQKKDVDDIALKALSMETIKRAFGIGTWVTADSVETFAEQGGGAKFVRALLLGEGDAQKAELNLRRATGIAGTVRLGELFPFMASTEATWAQDFLDLVKFWTGGLMQNTCLLLKDNDARQSFFEGIEGGLTQNVVSTSDHCDFVVTNGKTPTLLLRSDAPVTLVPNFIDTTIVSADRQFTNGNGWLLPAGDKAPLSYRYAFTARFPQKRVGEMCVTKARLPVLISVLESIYGLNTKETTALASELQREFPTTTGFVRLALADPVDIAARFVWQGNGEKLDLLQLFFELTPDACAAEQLIPPQLPIAATRDGFEAGIL